MTIALQRRLFHTAAATLLLTACASRAPLVPPQWEVVPPNISDALCARLKMDAIATGPVAIVKVTQPLVTPESLGMLRKSAATPGSSESPSPPPALNRAIPIALGGPCEWKAIDAFDSRKQKDEMVVELSNPILNANAREVGMFARVTLGGEHPAWYWIALAPVPEGWTVRFIFVLSK